MPRQTHKDADFVADPENAAEEDTRAHRRAERAQEQEQAQAVADATPRSADGTPVTPFEQAQAQRFEPINTAPEGELVDAAAVAEAQHDSGVTGAVDEAALGPLGSATQTGGTSYYAATDIKPAYATPYYPPTDYNFAAIDSAALTADAAAGGSFAALGLVAGDPYPPENAVQDQIETDGRANTGAFETKDYERVLHLPLFLIDATLRDSTTGKLPYPTNPDTGGGASGVVQDPERPV